MHLGQLVYLKNRRVKDQNKIQDIWNPALHRVVQCPSELGAVCSVMPVDGSGPSKQIHRTQLHPAGIKLPDCETSIEEVEGDVIFPGTPDVDQSSIEDQDSYLVEVTTVPTAGFPSALPSPTREAEASSPWPQELNL